MNTMKFLRKKCIVFSKRRIKSNYCTFTNNHLNETGSTGSSAEAARWPRRVVSALQPTGALHVGNYFGAVRRCVRLQRRGEPLVLFVADLHAHTAPQDPAELQRRSLETAAYLLASGVDAERGVLFLQSAVPAHARLCWLLACLATQARLAHLPQYRERAAGGDAPLGLLLYPVLQAADVLVYRATHVPVGADQLQHLQLTAQLVRTFHHRFGRLFPTPAPLLPDDGSDRIRSLRDPSKKMSKSDSDPKSRILLSDGDDLIRLKIQKAVTDFTPEVIKNIELVDIHMPPSSADALVQVSFDPAARPGVSNLVTLHSLAADKLPEEALEEARGLSTAQYKRVVADALCGALRPVRERAQALLARPALLHELLRHGAARARALADPVYAEVAARAGLAPAAPR
ncbi:tryptophan--tRNA ligase, mitochondrial isoform X1 [Bicyclus anynana]|uniref:tryptophan--tRNA ligase n=1 Tax=Bicyclus anynana TaxID=110368 RepID=A0ABM3LS79_BICAN|nr:tryptophan--tRNA ligase, mitochondrial isoform X1 [Bicyclus anynana]